METDLILATTRESLGLDPIGTEFNQEVLNYINSALTIITQNGAGTEGFVADTTSTWADFKNDEQVEGNKQFNLIPTFVFTKTKILFDPPPPSNVGFFDGYIKELEWRIRYSYEAPYTTTTTTVYDVWE